MQWHIHHRLNVYIATIDLRRYCDGGGATTRNISGGRSVWAWRAVGCGVMGLSGNYGADMYWETGIGVCGNEDWASDIWQNLVRSINGAILIGCGSGEWSAGWMVVVMGLRSWVEGGGNGDR